MKHRDTYFDFLRGFAIVMVVGIHTFIDTGLTSESIRQLLNCSVPLFLAISGYFIGRKEIRSKEEYAQFLKHQLPRVYIPMLIFSIPWALLAIRGGQSIPYTLIMLVLCSFSIFYFIALILQLYIITPIVKKVAMTDWGGNFVYNFSTWNSYMDISETYFDT